MNESETQIYAEMLRPVVAVAKSVANKDEEATRAFAKVLVNIMLSRMQKETVIAGNERILFDDPNKLYRIDLEKIRRMFEENKVNVTFYGIEVRPELNSVSFFVKWIYMKI